MSPQELQTLKAVIRETICEVLKDGRSPFPLWTVPQVADVFHVSPNTVRYWRKIGLLRAHYHALSGRSWRWLFTNADVLAFFEQNFPSEHDVTVGLGQGSEFNPQTSKVVQLRKMLSMRRLFARTHSRRKPASGSDL